MTRQLRADQMSRSSQRNPAKPACAQASDTARPREVPDARRKDIATTAQRAPGLHRKVAAPVAVARKTVGLAATPMAAARVDNLEGNRVTLVDAPAADNQVDAPMGNRLVAAAKMAVGPVGDHDAVRHAGPEPPRNP